MLHKNRYSFIHSGALYLTQLTATASDLEKEEKQIYT
jgi:hypothetical protein